MSSALVDLEPPGSKDAAGYFSLSQSTLQDLTLISDATMNYANHLSAAGSSVVAAPALVTRSSDAVIADLRRAREGVDEIAEDDEEVNELPTIPKQRKISERKRHQDAVFNSSFNKYLQKAKTKAALPSDNDYRSTRTLIKDAESQEIISSPRDYQVELFERAKEHNIIAVLDTGSGKTLIAVLLLRYILNQELEDRACGKESRISFFLVNSVTLVFQQHAVLERNLSQPSDFFCGDMGCDFWSKELWEKHFSLNMVIVCTAEVLYQCLHHGFISMGRINLLIFDEAHHAKKKHPYAQIVKDFYIDERDKSRLPRIFGMTASPADAKLDVKQAAAHLEALLHCQICTASDPSLVQYATSKKKHEIVAEYQPLQAPFETSLYHMMKTKFISNPIFARPVRYAKQASAELGAWCADQVWSFCLDPNETKKLESKTERNYLARKVPDGLDVLETQILQLNEAREIVTSHIFSEPRLSLDQMSPKVLKLAEILRERFERSTDDKCIVFVKQRYTCRLLAELFAHPNIGTPHLRVGALVGTRAGDAGDLKFSFREQVIIMTQFRKGALNCLFATSVAEEGLDIPDCNLIIRFDLYATLIEYIQSRGRARQNNSRYVHMVEFGNRAHAALIKEVYKNEDILRRFCQGLPSDRLLTGNDYDMDYFLGRGKTKVYTEPSTGAKLTYRMSLTVLANFVSSLPQSLESVMNPEYVMTTQNKQFICEVILPENSPVRGAIGIPASTKQVAKCSAAFEACVLLRKEQLLDANLLSTYKKILPAMRSAHLSLNSKKRRAYEMRTKPAMWSSGSSQPILYMTVISLANPEALTRASMPLGLLTRFPLPEIPRFPLFFDDRRTSEVIFSPVSASIVVDSALLDLLTSFTLRIFEDVFSKEYEPEIAKMPYFLSPIKGNHSELPERQPLDLIDIDILKYIQAHERLEWDDATPDCFFENRYIVDIWDGSRKFWSVKVTKQFKPLDPVPLNTYPRISNRKQSDNIMEYSISLWAKARARRTFKEVQPVIEAEYIPLRRNLLDGTHIVEPEVSRTCFVVPEPLKISALPTTVVVMAYNFPAIVHRLESYLIALEACNMLHLNIRPDLALEAMTKDSDNTEEHHEEQMHFQRGMGKNYERLEFIGDCFLKMATSISVFTMYPDSNEFAYHVKRMLMICNQNLLNNALNLKLYEYIRSQNFNRRAWYPEGLVLKKGKAASAPTSHNLADKTIADVSEALIGAALLSHLDKPYDFDNAVRAVTELVCSADHAVTSYTDYYKLYKMPAYQTSKSTAAQRNLAVQVEEKHSYHFRYPRLLRSAFIHPSYPFSYERIPCFQRLEFLGDSLLDMVCVNFLFHRFPTRDPQWLTEHKMAMVSNQFLGALCVSLGFHRHLLQFSIILQNQIGDYVDEITEARYQAEQDAVKAGNLPENISPSYWQETKQPPKCLADIIEAYIGAIFVDSQFNFGEVERFFKDHIQQYFEDMSLYDTFANKHPVTFLNNFLTLKMGCNKWALHARQLPNLGDSSTPQIYATVMVHEQIVASTEGASSKYTKVAVAKMALEILVGFPLPEFRAKYRCDCRDTDLAAGGEEIDVDVEVVGPGSAI